MRWIKTIVLAVMLLWTTFISATTITKVRVNDLPNQWQFVLDANQPIKYQFFTLNKPARAVIDLSDVQWRADLKSSLWQGSGISHIRIGQRSHNKKRLVLDMKSDYVTNAHTLTPSGKRSYRLVINVAKYRHQTTVFKRDKAIETLKQQLESQVVNEVSSLVNKTVTHGAKAKPKAKVTAKYIAPKNMPVMKATPIVVPSKKPQKLRQVVIVIDPGHGGKDPGATGRRGTHEKNVVLSISRQLQRLINQQRGFKAVLTRTGDYYLSLRKRLAIARKYKADMFIAVHADAYKNRKAHGASVYALSERGATSEAARWLAQRENKSELMGGVELSGKGHLLRSVLIDLSQTATISASLKIGNDMLHSLRRVTSLHHSVVEQAAFVVLKSPDIPSLLVETGFISNRHEENNLRSVRYQKRIANALMLGIKRYFVTYPPRHTWLAYYKNKTQRYVVHTGDTLSDIAQRYSVSVASLQRNNRLRSNGLRVGQVLTIPVEAG
ncbi:MAG: N-acetylmuramoyl-L-alanine amidase [Coxiellaceae bacterium]|nr:N-acetylmuramoyl-L-alanine amidase [Coxiellaceae bacterium]